MLIRYLQLGISLIIKHSRHDFSIKTPSEHFRQQLVCQIQINKNIQIDKYRKCLSFKSCFLFERLEKQIRNCLLIMSTTVVVITI